MRRSIVRVAVAAAIVLGVSAPGISAAIAGPYPSVTSSSSSGGSAADPVVVTVQSGAVVALPAASNLWAPGASGTYLKIGGFAPNSAVTLVLHSTPVTLGTFMSDASGFIDAKITVPATFAPGSAHTLVVAGTAADGKPFNASLGLKLGGATLPFTGADHIAEMAASATALIVLGTFLRFSARRRRDVVVE